MRGQIDRLTKLTTDLLDLSKLDSDAIDIRPRPLDVAEVAARVADEFAPAAEHHGSTVATDAPGRVAAVGDPDRVAQILRILIDNALTHTPQGTSIRVDAEAANGIATVTVADNGPGIDVHDRDRVFERFYTGDELGGSGLGLAIALELGAADGRRPARGLASRPDRVHPASAGSRLGGSARVSRGTAPLAALIAAAALALAACGGSGGGESTATTTGAQSNGHLPHVAIQTSGGLFNPAAVYDEVSPGVVTIRSIFGQNSGTSILGGGGGSAAQGSGFVISSDGEIATNAHVVTDGEAGGGSSIHEAKEVYVQFANRNQVPAEIVGFDPFADVALLKVDPSGLDLQPLKLGSTSDLHVGEPVAAIGSPFGEEQSLSTGIVSATDRSIDSLTDFKIEGAIQTDASINPGNSGGPLLNAEGEVIGLNQQINTTSGGNEGVGFSVPIDLAKRSLDQLRANGEVKYAYIGVTTQPLYPQLADRLNIDSDTGALVSDVVPGGPADDAGIRGGDQKIRFQGQQVTVGGDVITAVNGHEIVGEAELPRLVSLLDPGDQVTLDIIRDGNHQQIDVTLGERPENAR